MEPWLRAARGGDAAALRRLVETHAASVQRYVQRRMGRRLKRHTSAADLVQEVFTRVLGSLDSLPPDADERTLRARLYRHADWVLANHGVRCVRLRGESACDGWRPEQTPEASRPGTGPVTRQDEIDWLRSLVRRLDRKYARVVELRLRGLSFAAIGLQLGVREATVRQRYSRVCRALRRLTGDATDDAS